MRKTLAYISEKGVAVDVKPIGPGSHDPAFRAASPFVNLSDCGIEVATSNHPKLSAYLGKMLSRPSFAPMVAQERAMPAG